MANDVMVYHMYLLGFRQEGGPSAIVAATQHLRHVKELGATHVWASPIFPSPWKDHGYDISDHYGIEPRLGTMEEFDAFVAEAHELGLEVIIDCVPNHTSAQHEWFQDPEFRKQFYCWSDHDRPGWHNLFNGGSAWEYCEEEGQYYCHLFQESQADLNWLPDGPEGDINWELVKQFHRIIDFWTIEHHVDGFRIDVPQSINKDFSLAELQLEDLLFGDQAARVLSAIFGNSDLFLMAEMLDPTFGEAIDYYSEQTQIDFFLNILLKDQIVKGEKQFLELLEQSAQNPRFMLDLESHDSPRFTSRGATTEDVLWYMFRPSVNAVCFYQGQELGLKNPTKEQLPDDLMLELDAQTKMRAEQGESLGDLRPLSRANARTPLPLREFSTQAGFGSSYLSLTKAWIKRWREDK